MNNYILDFGTTVHCIDEPCGSLAKVAVDPKNWQVQQLIVEEGLLLKRARVFPLSTVSRATDKEIKLGLHEEELRNYPEYKETYVDRMPEGESAEPLIIQGSPYGLSTSAPVMPMIRELVIMGVSDNLVIVDKDTPLEAVDGTAGTVRGLAVVPSNGLITHLLIHKGTIFVDEFWLPTSVVGEIRSKGFFIDMDKEALQKFIEYDEERDSTWDRMPTDEPLETPPAEYGFTTEGNGTPYRTAGISDDAALAAMISDNLFEDPRTADAVIEVILERGMVTLQGTVAKPAVKTAAEEIAYDYPGVVSVTNELVVDARH